MECGLEVFGLELERQDEAAVRIRKGDPRRVEIATVIKKCTAVSNHWIAERLGMGHNRSVSRLIRKGNENREIVKLSRKLEKMLRCEADPFDRILFCCLHPKH